MSNWNVSYPPSGHHGSGQPRQPGPDDVPGDCDRGGDWDSEDWTGLYPLTYERDGSSADAGPSGSDGGSSTRAGDAGRPLRRSWPVLAGVAAAGTAAGVCAVLLAGGHPGTAPSAAAASAASAPITLAQAQRVLARYTTVDNSANARRSDSLLATVQTGSSYAIDATLYRMQQAAGTAPYPASRPLRAAYYIPGGEPASGPRWFVVQVTSAFSASPGKAVSTQYLLFTQAAPGGAWLAAAQPYLLPGVTAPRIATGADGLVTAVSPAATSVAVAPDRLAAGTATALDGRRSAASPGLPGPSDIADLGDQRFWHGKLPTATVTDTHAAAAGAAEQEFALRSSDGGALVFYTDTARLTITAPSGMMLRLTVPGLYSPAHPLSAAGLSYTEQFAAFDPPATRGGNPGAPRVVAGYSGITGKD